MYSALISSQYQMPTLRNLMAACLLVLSFVASAQTDQKVVDIQTRSGVTQRMLVLTPPEPKAAVILLAGGHGGLQIFPNGSMKWGDGNFLVRTRQRFADDGLMVAIVDAPSDRQSAPFLNGFRQTPEHVADLQAVIAWLRSSAHLPVWLVGTSRGTQSAAYVATMLPGPQGPDGVVLTSSILAGKKSRPVQAMDLENIRVPVLVVHHAQDGCSECPFSQVPALMAKLVNSPRSQLISVTGGQSIGDPCDALAYHGFNGIESEVVSQLTAWMLAK